MREKMKNDLKKRFFVDNPWKTIVQVLIYACVNSKYKEEYIERILCLKEETQHLIMEDIKEIRGLVEKAWEKDDLDEDMKKLEEENEVMKQIIEEFVRETEELKK